MEVYIGLDVSLASTAICVLGEKGEIVSEAQVASAPESLVSFKRLERGRFLWPTTSGGAVSISAAQLGYLLEGIDWRNPVRTWRPSRAG